MCARVAARMIGAEVAADEGHIGSVIGLRARTFVQHIRRALRGSLHQGEWAWEPMPQPGAELRGPRKGISPMGPAREGDTALAQPCLGGSHGGHRQWPIDRALMHLRGSRAQRQTRVRGATLQVCSRYAGHAGLH